MTPLISHDKALANKEKLLFRPLHRETTFYILLKRVIYTS